MSFIDDAKQLIKTGEVGDEIVDLLGSIIDALLGSPVSTGKVIYTLAKSPFLLREKLFWAKMENYLNGIYLSEDDRAKLRAKLMENGTSDENSKRLIECIDRAETSKKVQYLINATRCFLTDFIDRTTFFRICRAIAGTIDEDLVYLRNHIADTNFQYDSAIQGLLISGLVTFSVIGGEETLYTFTPLARLVDRFAVSYEDLSRYPDPTADVLLPAPNVSIPTATADEVNEMLDLTFGKTEKPNINLEIPMGEF